MPPKKRAPSQHKAPPKHAHRTKVPHVVPVVYDDDIVDDWTEADKIKTKVVMYANHLGAFARKRRHVDYAYPCLSEFGDDQDILNWLNVAMPQFASRMPDAQHPNPTPDWPKVGPYMTMLPPAVFEMTWTPEGSDEPIVRPMHDWNHALEMWKFLVPNISELLRQPNRWFLFPMNVGHQSHWVTAWFNTTENILLHVAMIAIAMSCLPMCPSLLSSLLLVLPIWPDQRGPYTLDCRTVP